MLYFEINIHIYLCVCVCLYSSLFPSAVTEDANRAIELKNGSSVGGRKIGVKHAMHRASLEQRRSKATQGLHISIIQNSFGIVCICSS